MALVSSLYRMAPPDGYPTKDEIERRLTASLTRLVGAFGEPEVIRKLREARVAPDQELTRAWLIVSTMAVDHHARRSAPA